jgi:hypothetical protein
MHNAFLVKLSCSVWTARKMDKDATKQARANANATEKAAVRVYKSVLATEALDKIIWIVTRARDEHEKRTVPWTYKGPGAITAEGYPAYKAAMAEYEKEFSVAVRYFHSVYAAERENARGYLGNMFNEADYPASDSLTSKFAFRVTVEPMPNADDFRVQGLAPQLVAEIKKDIVANNREAFEKANNSAWARVIEVVEKLKLRMEAFKPAHAGNKVEGKFHDTIISNIVELAELIPSINIVNDPDLTRMQRRLMALTAYTPKDLRDSDALRADVAKQASAVLAEIGVAHRKAA